MISSHCAQDVAGPIRDIHCIEVEGRGPSFERRGQGRGGEGGGEARTMQLGRGVRDAEGGLMEGGEKRVFIPPICIIMEI